MSLIFVTKIRNFDENLLRFAGSVLQARVVTRNIFIRGEALKVLGYFLTETTTPPPGRKRSKYGQKMAKNG